VAFDLETTGLRAEVHRIVEVGAIRFDATGAETGTFQSLVNPGCPVPEEARAVHGLGDADLADAPPARDVLALFLAWLGDPAEVLLLAHNASFDAGFLAWELSRAGLAEPGHQVVDTLPLARRFLTQVPNHRLGTLAERLGFDCGQTHRALADCRRVKQLWLYLQTLAGAGPVGGLLDGPNLVRLTLPEARLPFDPDLPLGSDWLATAIVGRRTVRLVYDGGTKGPLPREITPRSWVRRGGTVYITAFCHIDGIEKEFRLERIREAALVETQPRRLDRDP
jgi:DNA polymerase-3 subunit epsilon